MFQVIKRGNVPGDNELPTTASDRRIPDWNLWPLIWQTLNPPDYCQFRKSESSVTRTLSPEEDKQRIPGHDADSYGP